MKKQIKLALPTGSYQTRDPRASSKRLINAFSEIQPQTAMMDLKQIMPPITIRRMAGITEFCDDGTGNPLRGIWEMAGNVYVVIGPTLYYVTPSGTLQQVGTGITGTSFVRMSDNTACLFILVPNSSSAWVYTAQNGFSQFTDPTFLQNGAIDVWFLDSYFVFLALTGRTFYNDDGQVVSGQGYPTFVSGAEFPREFGTDPFVGFCIDHREALFFGRYTSEGFVNAGNPAFSPFGSAPDSFMQIGCHPDCAYTIALQDQSVFWVANDRTVRRRNGQTPMRVSNSGIESLLETADLTGSYALCPTIAGHALWVLTMPQEGKSIAYDCLTTEWFELSSFKLGYWRPLAYKNVLGKQFVGDSKSGKLGFLDTTVFTEFGETIATEFETQSVYEDHNRITHRRVEVVMTAGSGSDLTTPTRITLLSSDDSGVTFRANAPKDLGLPGERVTRAVWTNLGQSRDRVYKVEISDPSVLFAVDITAEIDVNYH